MHRLSHNICSRCRVCPSIEIFVLNTDRSDSWNWSKWYAQYPLGPCHQLLQQFQVPVSGSTAKSWTHEVEQSHAIGGILAGATQRSICIWPSTATTSSDTHCLKLCPRLQVHCQFRLLCQTGHLSLQFHHHWFPCHQFSWFWTMKILLKGWMMAMIVKRAPNLWGKAMGNLQVPRTRVGRWTGQWLADEPPGFVHSEFTDLSIHHPIPSKRLHYNSHVLHKHCQLSIIPWSFTV